MQNRHAGRPGGTGHEGAYAYSRNGCRRLMAAALLCAAVAFAALGGLPGPALAQAQGSQLPGGDYPDAQCTSPLRPFAGDKAWEWDIEIIQGKIDRAVREYNREVTMP